MSLPLEIERVSKRERERERDRKNKKQGLYDSKTREKG
jgi:hypothetical protein